jgi:hypothetical protein
MFVALRVCAYATFLVGLAMFASWIPRDELTRNIHLVLGLATALLALAVVPTGPGPRRAARVLGRFWPLLTAAVGLTLYVHLAPAIVVMVHAVMGILAVLFLELALSRKARAVA